MWLHYPYLFFFSHYPLWSALLLFFSSLIHILASAVIITIDNPGPLANFLFCANLEDDSITLLVAIHPKMALPNFKITTQRICQQNWIFPTPSTHWQCRNIEIADLKMFNSNLFYDIWLVSFVDPTGNLFCWKTEFWTMILHPSEIVVGSPPLNTNNVSCLSQNNMPTNNKLMSWMLTWITLSITQTQLPQMFWSLIFCQSLSITGYIKIDKNKLLTIDLPVLPSTKHSFNI